MNYNYFNPYNSVNIFTGRYVDNYGEVINTPAPANGEAMIFVNLDSGTLWSKKIISGTPVIQPYTIKPIYQENTQIEAQNGTNFSISPQEYKDLLESINALKKEVFKEDKA